MTSLTTALRYFYKILLGLEVDKLLYLLIVFINFSFEKKRPIQREFERNFVQNIYVDLLILN